MVFVMVDLNVKCTMLVPFGVARASERGHIMMTTARARPVMIGFVAFTTNIIG